MSLNARDFAEALANSASGGMPGAATSLSSTIKSYCEANGTPVKGINVQLLPCTGAGWLTLASSATGEGVGNMIISTAIATELAGSLTTITTPTGPVVTPSIFNQAAKVENLIDCQDYKECWSKIAQAIIDYLSPELV